jgi:hypothetical protein
VRAKEREMKNTNPALEVSEIGTGEGRGGGINK